MARRPTWKWLSENPLYQARNAVMGIAPRTHTEGSAAADQWSALSK
jgi:hypothetical protein